jgi:hypothetical protein
MSRFGAAIDQKRRVGDWAKPDFVVTFAMTNECTAGGFQPADEIAMEIRHNSSNG